MMPTKAEHEILERNATAEKQQAKARPKIQQLAMADGAIFINGPNIRTAPVTGGLGFGRGTIRTRGI